MLTGVTCNSASPIGGMKMNPQGMERKMSS